MKRFLTILLITVGINLPAQQYLYLKQTGEIPYKRLKVNDPIKIRVAKSPEWISGKITSIETSVIEINKTAYKLASIEAVRTYNEMLKLSGSTFLVGGVLFTGIVLINGLINSDSPLIRQGQVVFGSAMVSGGLLVRWLSRKTYHKSKGWQFEVIDLDKEFSP